MNTCQSKHKKLRIEKIKKNFGELSVIDKISFYVEENEFVSLLGPSGSGKSTIFNIISGLLKPDEGSVVIDEEECTGRLGKVSYMHQKDLLLPWKKIIDNAAIPLVIKGIKKKEARAEALKQFATFGLDGFEHKYPFQLSGGMRQRTALLRTYLASQNIMLLDEPFGALDAITRSKMQQWLLAVVKSLKTTIVFITHDIEEAIFLSDRIYVLSDRPAIIKAEILVDLPKDREKECITSEAFNKIKKQIVEVL